MDVRSVSNDVDIDDEAQMFLCGVLVCFLLPGRVTYHLNLAIDKDHRSPGSTRLRRTHP